MYTRSIESILTLRARAEADDREDSFREVAKKSYERGLYLAQYPHRDYAQSVAAFENIIATITTQIRKDKWRNSDYLLVMQCYERLVTYAVCNRTPLAVEMMKSSRDIREKAKAKIAAHAQSQAESSAWLEKAFIFHRDLNQFTYPGMAYYQTLLTACFTCAYGKYESSILLDRPISKSDNREIASIAASMEKIIEEIIGQPYRTEFSTKQLREISSAHNHLSMLFRLINDDTGILKQASLALQSLSQIADDQLCADDFFSIAGIYTRLASQLQDDQAYANLLTLCSNFFKGDSVNFNDFRRAVLRNSLMSDAFSARKEMIIQLMTFVDRYSSHPDLPISDLKTQLQNDVIQRFFKEDLQDLTQDKTKADSELANNGLFQQRPQTARTHTQTEYVREHIYLPRTPPILRKKTV
jgi:hypothetical protein